MWSSSAGSPAWTWSRSSTVGTGTTIANCFGSPRKSLAIVITVRSPSRTSTTREARLKMRASPVAT